MTGPQARRSQNLAGISWMIVAMAAFAIEDALIKAATRQLPLGEVMILFGAGGALVFALQSRRAGSAWLPPAARSRVMLLRAACELVGRLFYGLAVAMTPLSSATAILQATPILVVLGATVFFGERVGWRRWCAIAAGLAGVAIVLRPAAGDFSALSVLAVIGTLGFAGRDLASRAAPASIGTQTLGLYGFLTIVIAGALLSGWQGSPVVVPSADDAVRLTAAVAAGVLAYAALMKAMRTGEVAAVTPFRYTRLVFGIGLGALVFDERPDAAMLLGCAVIIGAGLAIWADRRREAASA